MEDTDKLPNYKQVKRCCKFCKHSEPQYDEIECHLIKVSPHRGIFVDYQGLCDAFEEDKYRD